MIDKSKKFGSLKRGRISEEDIFCLLQRYTATTVLALLQEVGQFEGVKIDWNAIVKKTSTGISSAREYQMLWRHLAYRHSLLDKLDLESQFLDDDSDLEYELEPYPEVTGEASAEAAASVKVLIASGLPSDTNRKTADTVEAPLTINIPTSCSIRATSANLQPAAIQGMNITVPVSIKKQPLPILTGSDDKDCNGSQVANNQSKRKRNQWSDDKDLELIAAVRKFGEGNWASIVKSQIMGDKTASQLSQRWGLIRKKNNLITETNQRNSQPSEVQRAALHAMNMALDFPNRKNTFTNRTGGKALGSGSSVPRPSSNRSLPAKPEPQKRPALTRYSITGSMGSATGNKGSNLSTDPVRAAAVAAGARIVSQSDAASLLKAAQANNAVHIMPKGSSLITPSVLPGPTPSSETHPKGHHLSTGVASAAARSTSLTDPKNAPPVTLQRLPPATPNSSGKTTCLGSPQKPDTKTVGGVKVYSSATARKAVVQEGGRCGEQVADDKKATVSNQCLKGNSGKMVDCQNSGPVPEKEKAENGRVDPLKTKPRETRIEQKMENKQQNDMPKTAGEDGCSEKAEKVKSGDETDHRKINSSCF